MNYAKEDFFTQVDLKTKLSIWVHTTNQLHGAELLLKIYQSQNSPPFIESYSLNCITTCPSSVFCTSSSTQLFSVSKILVLRERKFDHVITKNYTCQVQTQDFHRCFQKCPVAGLGNSGHMRRGSMENWLYLLRVKYKSSDISVLLQSSGPIFTNIFIIHIYMFPTQQQ